VFCLLSGKRFHYKIKRCDSEVVADQFLYNHDDKLVVTLRQSRSTHHDTEQQAQQEKRTAGGRERETETEGREPHLRVAKGTDTHVRLLVDVRCVSDDLLAADNVYMQQMKLKK